MKKRKRILAGLLVLCMMCSFLPVGALAATVSAPTTNLTTSGSPFQKGTGESTSFRIPALVTLSDGTLVAAADARWNTTFDGGGLDTMVAISHDNGATWTHSFANYLGDNGNAYNSASSCFIDPSLAVRTTDANNDGVKEDTIFMLCDLYPNGVALNGAKQCAPSFDTGFNADGYLKLTTLPPSTNTDNYIDSHFTHYLKDGKIYANDGTQDTEYTVDSKFNVFDANGSYVSNLFFADAPYHVARTGYLYLTKSTDGGASWSAPTLLNLKSSQEMACLVGPNGGMVTSSGTIVFPVYSYTGTTEQMGLIYSTDGGNTWQRSANFTALHSSEADAVELPNGKLRVFFRNQTATLRYADFDLTAGTWGSAVNTGIPTNSNTELSAITYSQTVTHNGKQKKVILISCPASANLNGSRSSNGSWRTSGRIFAGLLDPDTCEMTWLDSSVDVTPVASGQLSGNNYTATQGFFAYSSITELKDNGSVAILYEDNQYGWGSGTGYGYTLSYKTYTQSELEEKLGITFGDTLVNPDVPGEAENALSVTLNIGQTQTLTDPTGNHANNITQHPDSTIATMTVTGVDAQQGGISTTKATTLEGGATYILRVYNTSYALSSDTGRGDWDTQTLAFQYNALTDNTKHMWTLEKVDGGYKLKNANGYLNLGTGNNTAYLNTTGEVFTLAYTPTGWTIKNPHGKYINALGELFNYYSAGGWTEDSTRFDLYKVNEETAASTTIIFEGKQAGTTTATVGSTTYSITVLPDITKTVDITVQAGNTFIYTDNSGMFSDILIQPDANIATAEILGQLKPVTSIESGKQYLIVNKATGDILTDTVLSVPGDWGNKPGLDTTGKASAESTELWTITERNGEYTISQNGKYLAIAGFEAHLYDKATSLTLTYTPNGWTICDKYTGPALTHGPGPYYLSDYVGDNYTSGALGTSIVSNGYIHWDIYEVHPGGTVVEFTGITEGETTAIIGTTQYNITVVPVPLGNGFVASKDIELVHNGNKQIADLTDDDGSGKKITEMTLTVETYYDLNLATDVTGKTVEWTTENDAVAEVDDSGIVTATGVGTTNITATVKDASGNLVEVNTIPITVFPKGTGKRQTAIYIEDSENNTVWCVINANTDDYAFQVAEGELIYGQFDTTVADNTQTTAISFFSNPHDGHALVYMKSTNSNDQYFLLHDDDGNLYDGSAANAANAAYFVSGVSSGAGYWQAVGLGSNNTANVDWTPIRDMVQWSIDQGCDGGLGFTRRQTQGPLASNLSFVSNPMPRIQKTVDGVLPVTRKQANYRRYVENMVAAVGEQVYFKITITQEVPTVWLAADASKGIAAESVGAIAYTEAFITDTILPGGYLYTKELDQADGTWDGNIAPKYRSQRDDITDDLNAPWTADQKAAGIRSFDYYLVYEIQQEDIPKFWIDNIADLNYNYKSHYSYGAQAGSADAEARITVVGSDIDDVVIDFGQTITYTGLTNSQLKGVYVNGDDGSQCKASAKYGDVSVTREQICDADGVPQTDYNGYPLYNYTVTYTPHSILHEADAVVLYGVGEMGQEKIINGFLVYPATTVYYEEGFLLNSASTWNSDNASGATGQQTLELLGKSQYDEHGVPTIKVTDQKHPYGYDPLYEQEGYTHGNSYALSNTIGNTTTFTFTGTGFDLYANCDSDTGYVSVVVKNSAGKYVKMYTVNTVVKAGETPATSGQTGTQYHLPIVSADLKTHDTYTVTVTKIMDTKPVKLDGIRIYNTLADSSSFNIDLEDNPEFYQLRDYVLTAVDVNKIASKLYGPDWLNSDSTLIGVLGEQVYGAISTDSERPYAIITSTGDIYGDNATAQDLLDNGPKNELYLYPGQSLTFQVSTSREMQIGLKAPRAATSYTLCYEVDKVVTSVATEKPIATSVDMFYALGNPIGTEQQYLITVENTGSDILSVTNLKICDDPNAAFVPLTQKNIEQILVNSGLGTSEDEEQDPPVLPETPKFDIDLAQLRLGNELTLFFLFPMDSYADWTGCYAEITKPNGDTTVTVPVESWETGFRKDGKDLYRVAFDGLAAKEMADDVSIVIYNAKGEAISNVGTESIRSYLMRMLDKRTDAESRRLAVDMLNYGAAAQQYFSYNTGDLANSLLDDTQKAYGTLEDAPCQNKQIKGNNAYGTSLELGSSILVKFYFDGMTRDMTATVTFRSHAADKPVTYNLKNQGNHFLVDQIVVADGRQELVVTVYNADGSVYGTMTDSIESYVARGSDRDALYQAILKFSDSAYAYLHK